MKTIGDEYIRRVVGNEGNGGAAGGGGGGASTAWIGANFLSIEFFNQLFALRYQKDVTVMRGETVILHNITEYDAAPNAIITEGTETETDSTTGYTTTTVTTIIGIRANHGFWSNSFVSALGQGTGGGGGGATLNEPLFGINTSGLAAPTAAQNGMTVVYNGTTGKWEYGLAGGGGGISMTDVWTALAAGTSEQINASHLSDALNGYATQQWVGQQGFLTSSAISDMATKTWVGQQGFLTSSAISDMATQTWVGQQGFLTSSDISNMVTGGSLWGNSFTGNPSIGTSSTHASLNYVSSIYMSGDIKMNNNKAIYIKDSGTTDRSVLTLGSGNVLVLGYGTNAAGYATQLRGATVDYYTYNNNAELHVGQWTSDGQLYLMQGAKGIRIGDGCIVWDSTNNALKIIKSDGTSCNLYATGAVSALGISNQ